MSLHWQETATLYEIGFRIKRIVPIIVMPICSRTVDTLPHCMRVLLLARLLQCFVVGE